MNSISVNMQVKMTVLYKLLLFLLKYAWLYGFIKKEFVTKVMNWASSKGLLMKFRAGTKGKWKRMTFGIDLAGSEDKTVY